MFKLLLTFFLAVNYLAFPIICKYHNEKLEFFINNVSKDKIMLKKIEKSKKEEFPNFKEVYENRI